MTPEQKDAARQRMAHATAVRVAKRKQREELSTPNEVNRGNVATLEISATDAPDLVLTVRRLHVGSFTGLWELCRINSDGSKTVVTDANTKSIVMSLARNEIMKCGQ